MIILGSLSIQALDYIDPCPILKMINDSDYVLVNGNFVMHSNVYIDSDLPIYYFSAGTLEIKGDFTQGAYYHVYGDHDFLTSGSFTVILSGTTKQTITFSDPNYSCFNILIITKDYYTGYTFTNTSWQYIYYGDDYTTTIINQLQQSFYNGSDGVYSPLGTYSQNFTDMSVNASGISIDFTRTYNSSVTTTGSFGKGWTFGYEGSCKDYQYSYTDSNGATQTITINNIKVVKLPDGSNITFKLQNGVYVTCNSRNTLVENADGTFTLTTKDYHVYHFNSSGYLVSVADKNGNMVTITVNSNGKVESVTDATGRVYTISYNSSGYISTIADPTGRTVQYQYENGYLVRIIDPMGHVVNTYSYDSSGYLSGIRNSASELIQAVVYNHDTGDTQNRVTSITDANGNATTYSYDITNKKVTKMDSSGWQTIDWYNSLYQITKTQDAEGYTSETEYYNQIGDVKSYTDRNGNKTQYIIDSNGNVISIIYPNGSMKSYSYDSNNNLISQTDENGNTVYYVYDSKGNLIKIAKPLNGTDQYTDGCDISKFAITQYIYYTDVECAQLGYTVKGLVKQVIDPEGGVTAYTYDADGNVISIKDAETGYVTAYTYNSVGWVTSMTTPSGYTTAYEYDKNGKLVRITNAGGGVTRYVYDSEGRLIQQINPNKYVPVCDGLNNQTVSYTYTDSCVGDRYTYNASGKVVSKTDAGNHTTFYTYDSYGNVLTITQPNGSVYVYTYDALNRVTNIYFKKDASTAQGLLKTYSYTILTGSNTQITETICLNNIDSAITVYTYDYAGRAIYQQNADGTVVSTVYNSNGTINSIIRENGGKEYYKYDGLNRLTEKWVSIDAAYYTYTKITYDKCGRTVQAVSGIDKVILWMTSSTYTATNNSYYKNGKLKSVTDSDGRITQYTYDPNGYLSKKEQYTSSTDEIVTQYQNNYLGKPVKVIVSARNGDIYSNDYGNNTTLFLETDYAYDLNGNVIAIITPANVTKTYAYDSLNRLISTAVAGQDEYGNSVTITTSQTYIWDGKVQTLTDANENTTSYVYDERSQLIKKVNADGGVTAYYYDNAGRMIAVVSPNSYDSQKTLTEMNRTEYTYDMIGRVLTVSQVYYETASSQWVSYVEKAYKYDAQGNVVKQLDALGYQAGTGSAVSEKINSGYGTEYTYNLANQLITLRDPVSKDRSLPYSAKYDYDALGRLIKETDANGAITNYYYNNNGNLLSKSTQKSVSDSEVTTEVYTYDLLGRVLSYTDANDNCTTYEYNVFGKVSEIVYPGDDTISAETVYYQYDSNGNLARTWNITGSETLYAYDSQGRILSKTERNTNGTGAITISYKYDKNGNLRYVTDGNSATTEYTYDALNRELTQTKGGHTTTKTYDADSNILTATDWRNNTYTYVYDALNRLIETKDPYQITIQRSEYNNNSVQTAYYDALDHETSYTYDKNNRLVSKTDAAGHTTSMTYDNVGNIATQTDGDNNTTHYTYDEYNRLIAVINAKNEVTRYAYDGNSNVISFTDGKGNVTLYEYNVANQMVKYIQNGGRTGSESSYTYDYSKVESYTYYTNRSLHTKTDKNGNTTTYVYDVHGRLISQSVGSITITYTYDNNGNQLMMTDNTGTTTRTYDALNRVISKTVPGIGTSYYAYDITSGMSSGCTAVTTTDPKGNVVTKIYDKTSRLINVIADGCTTTYTYNNNGSLQRVGYSDGSGEDYIYTADNLLNTLTNKKADGTVIESYAYTYDAAHNLLSKVDAKGKTSYTYDVLNRLLTVTEPSGKITSYTYDAAGNRLAKTVVFVSDTTVTAYTYDFQNRLTSTITTLNGATTETVSYAYDDNGNELTQTNTEYVGGVPQVPVATLTNTYDVLNQLITTITSSGTIVNNTYNGDGLRVQKTVNGVATNYLYEYDKVILEVDSNGNQMAWNVYGANLISRKVGADTLTYMYNGHADVTALLDTDGTIVATYYYDAFGNVTDWMGSANNTILYAGYQYDAETGLYYLNARMYDPVSARFLQEDTYRGQYTDPLSLNLYTYCHNEPLMYTDPSGHSWLSSAFNAVGEFFSGVGSTVSNAAKTVVSEVKEAGNRISKIAKNVSDAAGKFVSENKGAIIAGIAVGTIVASLALTVATGGLGAMMLSSALMGSGISIGGKEVLDYMDNGKIDSSARSYAAAGVSGFIVGGLMPLAEGMGAEAASVLEGYASFTGSAVEQAIGTGKIDMTQALETGVTGGLFCYGLNKLPSIISSFKFNSFKNWFADETGTIQLGAKDTVKREITVAEGAGETQRVVNEYDIVTYKPSNAEFGFENHHGVMDAWAKNNIPGYKSYDPDSIAIALSKENHNATRSVFGKWKYENYGFEGAVDWKNVSPREIQNLSENMFDAARVPNSARQEYYNTFNKYIYNLEK